MLIFLSLFLETRCPKTARKNDIKKNNEKEVQKIGLKKYKNEKEMKHRKKNV